MGQMPVRTCDTSAVHQPLRGGFGSRHIATEYDVVALPRDAHARSVLRRVERHHRAVEPLLGPQRVVRVLRGSVDRVDTPDRDPIRDLGRLKRDGSQLPDRALVLRTVETLAATTIPTGPDLMRDESFPSAPGSPLHAQPQRATGCERTEPTCAILLTSMAYTVTTSGATTAKYSLLPPSSSPPPPPPPLWNSLAAIACAAAGSAAPPGLASPPGLLASGLPLGVGVCRGVPFALPSSSAHASNAPSPSQLAGAGADDGGADAASVAAGAACSETIPLLSTVAAMQSIVPASSTAGTTSIET